MKHTTIRKSLLISFSIVILILSSFLSIVYGAIETPSIRARTFATLQQNTAAIASSAENELDQMRTVAMNISFSTMVQERFFFPAPIDPELYSQSANAQLLSTLLTTMIFPNRPVDQINLYSLDGALVASGLNNEIVVKAVDELPWYDAVKQASNHQIMFFSGSDEKISKYFTGYYGKQFISYVLENYDQFHNVCGYIEIKQRLNRIFGAAIAYQDIYGEQIYCFDHNGTLLFPEADDRAGTLFSLARDHGFPETFTGSRRQNILCAPCDKEQFYVIMTVTEAQILEPVLDQMASLLLVTLFAVLAAFLLSYFASRRITVPIEEICCQIGNLDISDPSPLPPLQTDMAELQTLHQSFDQMQSTLSEHVTKLLTLQKQEMQSRMLALQSQMNPHFLFNSLSAVQAMSDEGMNREISIMCQSMANILRYISSDSAQEVPLGEELRYTRDYLTCMEIRYQGDLSYSIQVPEAMEQVLVPKLCVQLLVENAIKFTTAKRPPYRIEILGVVDDTHYEIQIRDNGPGFDAETLTQLQHRMEEIRQTSLLPSLKINGMGILNVFIRFHLLHANHFIFRLENNPEGGARVVIGEVFHETNL